MICKADGFRRDSRRLGMCEMHYKRFKRHGDASVVQDKSWERGEGASWADTARFALTEEGKRMVDMFRDGEVA